jgi:H+/Cl- antiporter ClcA
MTAATTPTDRAEPMTSGAIARILLVSGAMAIPLMLAALLFIDVEHEIQDWLWETLPETLGPGSVAPLTLIVPVVGGLAVALLRRYLHADEAHSPVEGLGGDPPRPVALPGILLGILASLVAGASLGPEAALAVIGTGVGLIIGQTLGLAPKVTRLIAFVGMFATFAALFGPIPTWIIIVEGALLSGTISIPILVPGLLAAGIGQIVLDGVGPTFGIEQPALSFVGLPAYTGVEALDAVWAVGIGVVVAGLAAVTIAGIRVGEAVHDRVHVDPIIVLPLAGLVIGAVALALGENGQLVLFSGQAQLQQLLAAPTALTLGALVAVIAGRIVTYSTSMTSGFLGGPIFPVIFLGGALGTAVHLAVPDAPYAVTASVGMAGMVAAFLKLPMSAVVLTALLWGSSQLVGPIIVGTIVAYVLTLPLKLRPEAHAEEPHEQASEPAPAEAAPAGTKS